MNPRVLVLCDDPWHPAANFRHGLAAFSREFDFEFVEDGAAWPAVRLPDYPVAVLAKANLRSSKNQQPWLTEDSASALDRHLRGGNGLLVVHSGASRYETVDGMKSLVGGAFVSHPEKCAVHLEPVIPHPMTQGVERFVVEDEHYFMSMADADVDVFLFSSSRHGLQPAGWTLNHGSGRICTLTPGHGPDVLNHAAFSRLLLNALRWTAKLN